jgi:hypothetical protein
MDPSAIAAWVGVPIAVASVLVALIFSSRQVRLAGLQNLSPVILDAFSEARSAEWFQARDWIMANLPSQAISPEKGVSGQTDDDARWNMRRVGFFYDNLGVFVAHGIVSEDLARKHDRRLQRASRGERPATFWALRRAGSGPLSWRLSRSRPGRPRWRRARAAVVAGDVRAGRGGCGSSPGRGPDREPGE